MVINANPETKVLAKVYQLYIVEYQCAFKLINHNQGMEDNTVNANRTINTAAQTVLSQIYFLPSSIVSFRSSMLLERWRIFLPKSHQPPMVIIVHIVKKPLFKN